MMAHVPRFHASLVLCALAFAASQASASTAIIAGTNLLAAYSTHPTKNPSDSAAVGINITTFRALTSTAGSFAAFCVEPFEGFQSSSLGGNVNGNTSYDDPSALSSALPNYDRVVTLFDKYYAQASVEPVFPDMGVAPVVNTYRYAFQIALWQLVADNGTIAGNTMALAPESDPYYDTARDWHNNTPMDGFIDVQIPLDSLMPDVDLVIQMLSESATHTAIPKYELKLVNHANSQDMLIAISAVPEPSGYALMLAGAACLVAVRRRNRSSQAA